MTGSTDGTRLLLIIFSPPRNALFSPSSNFFPPRLLQSGGRCETATGNSQMLPPIPKSAPGPPVIIITMRYRSFSLIIRPRIRLRPISGLYRRTIVSYNPQAYYRGIEVLLGLPKGPRWNPISFLQPASWDHATTSPNQSSSSTFLRCSQSPALLTIMVGTGSNVEKPQLPMALNSPILRRPATATTNSQALPPILRSAPGPSIGRPQ
ncbi:hypothetical protein BD779DRAFT_800964 [Infundibulicybe gibba]|nr:hypothetical protein BD779DRAFT_800964 [Infundibulicybe gibba]